MKLPLMALGALVSLAPFSLFSADMMAPAPTPPAGLAVTDVPMFVMIGFDDNPAVDQMTWIVDYMADAVNPAGSGQAATFDGAPARAAFYSNGKYLEKSRELSELHHRAQLAGHEMGNHTHNHDHGAEFSVEDWTREMAQCRAALLKAQVNGEGIQGFRTPFLEYNPATFVAAAAAGFTYDTTLEEGNQDDQDGTNFFWPYTLDHGSPGNVLQAAGNPEKLIRSHPGLWEIPLHVFMMPSDEDCERYGVPAGMRQRAHDYIKANGGWDWPMEKGKITGLDWNVLEMAGLDGSDFLAILKHTLDLRLAGNRAPLMVGGHTELYPSTQPDRREAMEQFIAYALSHPDVRLVTPLQFLEWMRAPVALQR